MRVTRTSRIDALETVTSRIEEVQVVLDLGAGINPQPFVTSPGVHICVDAHRPYLERLQRERQGESRYVFVHARWDEFMPMLPDKSVDTVFALDFIEHLEKQDGIRMLREAQRVARRQVVVYTPQGFFPQSYDDSDRPDRWGMDGGRWQTHRSGWDEEDFGEQWEILICPDYILLDENNETMERPMGALWAILDLAPFNERRYVPVAEPSIWTPARRLAKRVLRRRSSWEPARRLLQRGLPAALYDRICSVWEALHRPPGQ